MKMINIFRPDENKRSGRDLIRNLNIRPEWVVGRTRALVISGALPVRRFRSDYYPAAELKRDGGGGRNGDYTFGVYINREFPLIGRCATVVRKPHRDPSSTIRVTRLGARTLSYNRNTWVLVVHGDFGDGNDTSNAPEKYVRRHICPEIFRYTCTYASCTVKRIGRCKTKIDRHQFFSEQGRRNDAGCHPVKKNGATTGNCLAAVGSLKIGTYSTINRAQVGLLRERPEDKRRCPGKKVVTKTYERRTIADFNDRVEI